MKNKKLSYIWVLLTALIFPMLQNVIYFMRFANLPADLVGESMIFIPMGLIAGALFIYLANKDETGKTRLPMLIGAIIATPFALYLSIISGLIVAPIIAVTIFGSIPLIIGIVVGYSVKKKLTS